MPKKQVVEEKVMLGKPGNNVSIGLVGLPNVGKSSLFNLFGGLQVPAENFPFCTIDPAVTQVAVPDERFDDLVKAFKPKKELPAVLTVKDIAGLIKGAHKGDGLGNAFLSHIQAVDAIFHVTRAFIDKEIEHVDGNVEPTRDFCTIRNELIQKDLEWMGNKEEAVKKKLRSKKEKEVEAELKTVEKVIALLKDGKDTRFGDWRPKEIININQYPLLTAKPVVYLVNISKKNFVTKKNKFFKPIKEWMGKESSGDPMVPFSVTFEQHLLSLEEDEKKKYLDEQKCSSFLPKVIISGYRALNLIHFFTVGPDEVRAWSIRKGTKAPGAAGVIHGDFEKHFISADVYNYKDFKECDRNEKTVKAKGKVRSQGKEYVVQDGDIILFKHNAGGAKKKK